MRRSGGQTGSMRRRRRRRRGRRRRKGRTQYSNELCESSLYNILNPATFLRVSLPFPLLKLIAV